jgi:hypothetical protein
VADKGWSRVESFLGTWRWLLYNQYWWWFHGLSIDMLLRLFDSCRRVACDVCVGIRRGWLWPTFFFSCQCFATRPPGGGRWGWQLVGGHLRTLFVVVHFLCWFGSQEDALAHLWNWLRDFRGAVQSASELKRGGSAPGVAASGSGSRVAGADCLRRKKGRDSEKRTMVKVNWCYYNCGLWSPRDETGIAELVGRMVSLWAM